MNNSQQITLIAFGTILIIAIGLAGLAELSILGLLK